MKLGLERALRLGSARDYSRVFQRAQRSSDHLFTVLARPNDADGPRLGLAVAKKHVPKAVGRNRIKRQIRESFRLHQDRLPPVDVVVVARADVRGAENAAVRSSLERHWRKISKR